ncbi:cytochrome P450 4d2-like [Culicoides brevitarsis]|uniref:cytochrome P450 4d2-like n=1 Tax=Culicoides brevitarsis TaxID=469753 RepID=UPI00307B4368
MLNLIILAILVFIIWVQWKWEREDARMNIPGPPWIPVFGNLLELYGAAKQKLAFHKFQEYQKLYGDTIKVRFAHIKLVATRDIKFQEIIANNPKFIKSDEYESFRIWLGNSLVIAHGERWQKLRKMLTPAFHFQILERFVQIFEEQSDVLVKKLQKLQTTNDAFDVFHAFSLDVISESAMGVKINSQNDPKTKFVEANTQMLFLCYERLINPFYRVEWIWKLTNFYKKQVETVNYINDFVNNLIEIRREVLLAGNETSEKENSKPVFIDILLKSELDGRPLSNEEIRAEVNTFMFAGHETTGSTLAFVMYQLAKNPTKQKNLYEEIRNSRITDSPLTMKSLNSLPYLDGVIKEALRIHPIFPSVPKKCIEDVHFNGMFIPKNTVILTTFHPNHMDPKYFPNPKEFSPERWLTEISSSDRNPYIYQPFSSGLRNCIGQKFAMLEAKTAIVKIISQFDVTLADKDFKPRLSVAFTIKSENGMPLKFTPRPA